LGVKEVRSIRERESFDLSNAGLWARIFLWYHGRALQRDYDLQVTETAKLTTIDLDINTRTAE